VGKRDDEDQPCKRCGTFLVNCMANRGRGRKPKLCCTSCDHSPQLGFLESLFAPKTKIPARKSACFHCGSRVCGCGSVIGNGKVAVETCTQMCRGPKGGACGKKMPGGVCPCGYC
jgi:hypothetical protein